MYQNSMSELLSISGTDVAKCMKCGRCTASCPNAAAMDIPPHRIVSYVTEGRLQELLDCSTLWQCLSCFACVQRCPRGVKPGGLIEAARLLTIRQQGEDYLDPNDVPELLDPNTPQQLLVSAFRKYRR